MIFVTGTDTDCGKTTVGRAMAAAMRARGHRVAVFKPFESGCEERGGRLVAADAEALARAAGWEQPLERICPVRLRLAASPERAAEDEGRILELGAVMDVWARLEGSFDVAIVEGAGGLLVPITPSATMADLAKLFGLPLIVVARDALGTVNHTLLTVEVARARGLDVRGVIFSGTTAPEADLGNARAIEAHGGVPILGALPYLPNATDERLGRAAEEHLDLGTIFDLER